MDSSADDFSRPEAGDHPSDGPAPPYGSLPPAGGSPAHPEIPADSASTGSVNWDDPDWDIEARVPPENGPLAQGMWLTDSGWLPPELLSSGGSASADADAGAPTGFGQGGVLDQLPPGPVMVTLLAQTAGGIAGTGVTPPPAEPSPAGAAGRPGTERPGQAPQPATAPGPALTPNLAGEPPSRLAELTDEDLTGVIRAWRKQASMTQAGELAAVAELTRRRHAEAVEAGFRDSVAADGANDEVAAALTLSGRAAELVVERARALADLPRTFAALAVGRIDVPKALVLITGLGGQDPALARTVEAEVIDRAGTQITGQLRAALTRALLAADPAAAERRRQHEEKLARIEQIPEPGGLTGTLAGRFLPVTAAVAAWSRITALARQLKQAGAPGPLDQLRVHVYLALLTGQAATVPASPGSADPSGVANDEPAPGPAGPPAGRTGPPNGPAGPAAPPDGNHDPGRTGPAGPAGPGPANPSGERPTDPAGDSHADPGPADCADEGPADPSDDQPDGRAGQGDPPAPAAAQTPRLTGLIPGQPARLTGTVNLTVPLTTLLGLTQIPGELGGFGPITAHTAREVTAAALDSAAVRWCVTVTGDSGQAVGHGCAHGQRPAPADPGPKWSFTVKVNALASTGCGRERESNRYRPPPSLWHLIQIRNQRCTYPGCRMPAARCDDEHTIPFEKGGRTCECNLAPVCRHHHRVKQLQGWKLEQPEPGVLAWVTPAGWKYITGPANYPA